MRTARDALTVVPVQKTQKRLATTLSPQNANRDTAAAVRPAAASPDQNQNSERPFIGCLEPQRTTHNATRGAPSANGLSPFSGHSHLRGMSALAARRAQYQASQNQKRGAATSSTAETDDGAPLRWSTADDRSLEEAVAWGWDVVRWQVRWGQVVVQ